MSGAHVDCFITAVELNGKYTLIAALARPNLYTTHLPEPYGEIKVIFKKLCKEHREAMRSYLSKLAKVTGKNGASDLYSDIDVSKIEEDYASSLEKAGRADVMHSENWYASYTNGINDMLKVRRR